MDKNWRAYERNVTKERRTHVDKFPRIQLFRAGLQTGLVRMKEIGFANEKQIQKLIEGNIETLFPGLAFLKTEFREMTDGERRLDTIVFDMNDNTFVVIEYKNRQDGRAVPQAKAYLKDMRDNKSDLVLLAHDNGIQRKKRSFNWDAMYSIIMAPEFEKFQIPAAADDGNLELYEIKRYDDLVVNVERVGGNHMPKSIKQVGGLGSSQDVRKGYPASVTTRSDAAKKAWDTRQNNNSPPTYTEEDYLSGKYRAPMVTDLTKNLWRELRNAIEDAFEGITYVQMKAYGRYLVGGKTVCTPVAQKDQIYLYYSTRNRSLLPTSDFVDIMYKDHHGLGDFRSTIRTSQDIKKAILLIKKVYDAKN